jgi:hypothetical protein
MAQDKTKLLRNQELWNLDCYVASLSTRETLIIHFRTRPPSGIIMVLRGILGIASL